MYLATNLLVPLSKKTKPTMFTPFEKEKKMGLSITVNCLSWFYFFLIMSVCTYLG
jgi:hypothetical protein